MPRGHLQPLLPLGHWMWSGDQPRQLCRQLATNTEPQAPQATESNRTFVTETPGDARARSDPTVLCCESNAGVSMPDATSDHPPRADITSRSQHSHCQTSPGQPAPPSIPGKRWELSSLITPDQLSPILLPGLPREGTALPRHSQQSCSSTPPLPRASHHPPGPGRFSSCFHTCGGRPSAPSPTGPAWPGPCSPRPLYPLPRAFARARDLPGRPLQLPHLHTSAEQWPPCPRPSPAGHPSRQPWSLGACGCLLAPGLFPGQAPSLVLSTAVPQ